MTRVGQEVVVVRPVELAPDRLFTVQPGDVGTVVAVTEDACIASFRGLPVALPFEAVRPVRC